MGAHDDRLPPKPADPVLSMGATLSAPAGRPLVRSAARRPGHNYARRYWVFAVPAGIVVIAVTVFPWLFTLFMSVHDWHIGGTRSWAGLVNYAHLLDDERFQKSIIRTLYFTALSVAAPVVLGVAAAVCFHRDFPGRGIARTIFIKPMMATPVAVALVWTMMFHP
jgi:multiple sugar transport system permease protein